MRVNIGILQKHCGLCCYAIIWAKWFQRKTLRVTIYILQKIANYDANNCGINNFNIKHWRSPFIYSIRLRATIPCDYCGLNLLIAKNCGPRCHDCGLNNLNIKQCGPPFIYCERLRDTMPIIAGYTISAHNIAGHHLNIVKDCGPQCQQLQDT